MRNPLKHQPTADPKPTLRERAAALRATAGHVMGRTKPEEIAAPDVPDARAFALEQAALIDLSALSIMQLGTLFERFDAASNAWTAELHLPYADERGAVCRINTAAGDVLEREQERVAEIRDRIAAEISRRQPAGSQDADTQLETLVRHELMCNGDLRDPAIRARINATWGEVASSERVELAGNDRFEPGFVLYEDAAGTARRAPVAGWINFMARRLYSVAKGELDRGFNAACANEPDQDANALYDRLRLDLRIDALHDLAFFSQAVFDASRDYAVGARRLCEGGDAGLIALGRKFDAAHEAWRKAVEINREPNRRFTAFVEAAKARGGPSRAELQAAYALPGVSEASDVEEKAFEAAGELALAILRLPAHTTGDLGVQARAVIPHVWASGSYEKDGAPDADENIDKEAVRSLIESCCAAAGVDWRGTPVGGPSTVEPADDGRDRQSPLGDLLAGLDLSTIPMRTLSALHEHVETLNTICYGLASQPRSLNRDHMLNEAGTVMYRLTEELLQRASNACLSEARRRASAPGDDPDIRLAMLARAIIENDDHDEIRALARDLLVMTET